MRKSAGKKKRIAVEEVTQKPFWSTKHVQQPLLHFPVARNVIVPVYCAQTASRVPKTQSVNLNVCVIYSPASISSPFFPTPWEVGGGAKRKETRMYRKETVMCELRWSSLTPATIRRSCLTSPHLSDSVVFHLNGQVAVRHLDGKRRVSNTHDPTCCPPQVGSPQPFP